MDINYLENLIYQLNQLYQLVIDTQKKQLVVTPEMYSRISNLRKVVGEVADMTKDEMRKAGLTQEMINKTLASSNEKIPPKLKDLINQTKELKKEVEGCQNVLKPHLEGPKKNSKKSFGEQRKDKFKKMGGKKGWMPL